jgi:hypothetical protein
MRLLESLSISLDAQLRMPAGKLSDLRIAECGPGRCVRRSCLLRPVRSTNPAALQKQTSGGPTTPTSSCAPAVGVGARSRELRYRESVNHRVIRRGPT